MVETFEIVSEIVDIETIAVGSSIREINNLRKQFGAGRWRKLKGSANVRLRNGKIDLRNCIGMKPMGSAGER